MSVKQLKLRIFGQVQGVGFRYFAHWQAEKLNIVGYVLNESDGSITILAEGPKEKLVQLIENCRQGPSFSKVAKIEEMWQDASGQFKDFKIF